MIDKSMIAGKTYDEILLMKKWTRKRWYKIITVDEKREVMRIIKNIGRAKQRIMMMGENNPMYDKIDEKHHMYGKLRPQHSERMTGKDNPMYGLMGKNNPNFGSIRSEESKIRISISQIGENNSNWRGGLSFEPYCELFNDEKKEEIRNRDNRVCQLCGKSEILNGQRMSVHHIDGDKMQGCGKKWHLVALCNSCNSTPDTVEKEFLIVSNLRWRI